MSKITVKELEAPTGFDLKIAAGETLDLKSQGTVIMPAGAILQVVQGETSSYTSTSSSAFTATTLSANITPSSTSSKIFITYNASMYHAAGVQAASTIYRGNTNATGHSDGCCKSWYESTRGHFIHAGQFLDSPNTTSEVTYKIYVRKITGSGSLDFPTNESTVIPTITLMEIAG